MTWAIALIGAFYLFTLVLGYGAASMVGPDKILAAPGKENAAAPLLAFELGGTIFLGIISAVAFATILAVVAGLAITASASFAHDIYASVIKRGNATEEQQVRVSRITVVVIGLVSIVLGIMAMGQNIAFLVALAFAVAASANLPTLLYSLFWKKFNTTGALFSIYGGLVSCLTLIVFSPAVSGQAVVDVPELRLRLVPALEPRHRLDSAGIRPRHRRYVHRTQQDRRSGKAGGDGSSLPHRRRRRKGCQPLRGAKPRASFWYLWLRKRRTGLIVLPWQSSQ